MAPDTTQVIPKQGGDITYKHMVDEMEDLGESDIKKVFRGSSILLTGGTGFLGKLMIDKLLRSCPDINKLYILVRPKKNKDSTKRLQEQFEDPLYDILRKEQPDFLEHVYIIEGDVGKIGLGISEENKTRISNEVEFIFHGAATVRFDEPLKTAVEINVRGTREMLTLARSCHKLKAMVHVSTAYSNCVKRVIDEKFYESSLSGDKLINIVENVDDQILKNITLGLIGEFPNTYAYTKLAAEDILMKHGTGLPVALFRPSIVISTAKEPIAGWIDNVYGPTGVVVGASLGLIRVLLGNELALADLVPADYVVNAIIAAAWRIARDHKNQEQPVSCDGVIPIYNYVSSEQKPLTWYNFMKYNELYGLECPSIQAVYYYIFLMTPSKLLYTIFTFFLHWIPAYLVDWIAILIGKKPMLRKAYTKIEKFSQVIAYFSCREWKIYNRNTQNLYNELNEADKHIFNFDMGQVDWADYFKSYIRGIRVYLIKDPIDTIPYGYRRYYALKCIHYIFCTILGYLFLRLFWAITKYVLGF